MSSDRELLIERIDHDNEALPKLRANAEATRDSEGRCANILGLTLRGLGIAGYVINQDVPRFRDCVSESVRIALSLFERAEGGDPIDWSYLTLLAYQDVFDALAVREMKMARALAGHIGRQDKKVREKVHPFDIALGYCLRAFVRGDEPEMRARAELFRQECEKKGNRDFRGYVRVFRAILARDSAEANAGFVELLNGHRRQCKGNGVFRFTADEDLCVWGLGMANLARHYGLNVTISDPLIPTELIV